ncbi:MAG TPA: AAA family ATPase [Alphaproteobacteria bacterium]|nr:AAA family ATPase [Alphaproteobacteria bacterium]
MRLEKIRVGEFRNLQQATLGVPAGVGLVLLHGPNGAGKTSLLEGLSLLAGGRGLLGADAKEQLRHGARAWGVHGWLADGCEIGVGFQNGKKLHKLDGDDTTGPGLARVGAVVSLSPRLDRLFSDGSPSERRAWLDDAAGAWLPAHGDAVTRYVHHLRSRLKLLADGRGDDWLDAEERMAAQWGIEVLRGRFGYLEALRAHLNDVQLTLAGNALEVLAAEDPVAALAGKFFRSREIDARMERTHAGPNTLDVVGVLDGKIKLDEASSGQHKRALAGWLLAQVRLLHAARGSAPLVLVDELSAHLDAKRRKEVAAELAALGVQVWASDTESTAAEGIENVLLVSVHDGQVG